MGTSLDIVYCIGDTHEDLHCSYFHRLPPGLTRGPAQVHIHRHRPRSPARSESCKQDETTASQDLFGPCHPPRPLDPCPPVAAPISGQHDPRGAVRTPQPSRHRLHVPLRTCCCVRDRGRRGPPSTREQGTPATPCVFPPPLRHLTHNSQLTSTSLTITTGRLGTSSGTIATD